MKSKNRNCCLLSLIGMVLSGLTLAQPANAQNNDFTAHDPARSQDAAPLAIDGTRYSARGGFRPAVHVGGEFRKTTVAMCTLKAVEAMGYQQNFIYARVDGSSAWGYDERSFVLVHAVPLRDGLYIFVAAFSADDREAERLRSAIQKHVFDGPYNPLISQSMHTANPNWQRGPLMARWGYFQQRATISQFAAYAQNAMKTNGLRSSASGDQIICGQNRTTTLVALGVGRPLGTQVFVIAVSADTKEAAQRLNAVSKSLSTAVTVAGDQTANSVN